ncbi:MAG TPA: HEAT repeat domain-containing protein [Bryobacteraceae bacterium]|nr:HEAT repeat domain-containing protein [Bryobacteraceae bacterium]
MSCAEARSHFWLLEYGELSFDEEERIETHLDRCADCRAARARTKELREGFDSLAVEPPASLLRDCRADLATRLEWEPPPPFAARQEGSEWWGQFLETLTSGWVLRPAGAVALLALGFMGARLAPSLGFLDFSGASEAGMSRVRDVQASSDGRIRIVVDETRQRTVTGAPGDRRIQTLLLNAARDPSDPGLREESLSLLDKRPFSREVRDMLVYALKNDDNAGVRMRAIEGLKEFAADPEVRSALSQALLGDANPGIRMRAIDLLAGDAAAAGAGGNFAPENMDRQIIGTLQQLMLREDNAYLRQRSQRILEAANASTEIY